MIITNIAVVLLLLSCILNSILFGILRRDNNRIWANIYDIAKVLHKLTEEKGEK